MTDTTQQTKQTIALAQLRLNDALFKIRQPHLARDGFDYKNDIRIAMRLLEGIVGKRELLKRTGEAEFALHD